MRTCSLRCISGDEDDDGILLNYHHWKNVFTLRSVTGMGPIVACKNVERAELSREWSRDRGSRTAYNGFRHGMVRKAAVPHAYPLADLARRPNAIFVSSNAIV